MAIRRYVTFFALFVALTVFSGVLSSPSAEGTLLYKNYVVREDRGREILCEPYVVKKNDWVYKLFRESGEISQKDYPSFLRIFKRLNPHIHNLDIIRPGEHILIPLKKVQKDSMPGQSSGVVSVPFLSISNLPELLKTNSTAYEVKKGDYVSKLVARAYGGHGNRTFKEGLKLFQILNPNITDLDLIYPGQRLQIPSLALRDQPWYEYLLVGSGDAESMKGVEGLTLPSKHPPKPPAFAGEKAKDTDNPFKLAASILDGKYLNRGVYYFPRKGQEDAELDLSQYSIIELQNGSKVLFSRNEDMDKLDMNALQAFWKDISIASISPDATVEQILDTVIEANERIISKEKLSFSDQGVEIDVKARWVLNKLDRDEKTKEYLCVTFVDNEGQLTPEPVISYLEQRNISIWDIKRKNNAESGVGQTQHAKAESVVPTGKVHQIYAPSRKQLFGKTFAALGYQYRQDVNVPLAFSDVRKTVQSNLLSNDAGKEVVVDFNSMDTEAIKAIEKAGYDILKPEKERKLVHMVEDVLRLMNEKYTVNPVFFAAARAAYHNTRIMIPGFLVKKEKKDVLLITTEVLNDDLVSFLTARGLNVVMIQER